MCYEIEDEYAHITYHIPLYELNYSTNQLFNYINLCLIQGLGYRI